MSKMLIVSDKVIREGALDHLKGRLDVTTAPYGEVKEVGDCQIIVCDLNSDLAGCEAEVSRLRVLCGFREVSILVAAADELINEARLLNRAGANSVLRKPFDREQTLAQVQKALQPVGVRTQIDMSVVTPFIDSTVQVIKTMTGSDVKRTDLFLKKSYSMFGDVSGVMGLAGATEGVVVLTFHQDLAFTLVAKIVGCEASDLSFDDVNDGIGEIINMISGNAKAVINSSSQHGFAISLPTVILGHGHQIAHKRSQPVIAIVFECEGRPFAVQLCVSSESQPTEAKAGMPAGQRVPVAR